MKNSVFPSVEQVKEKISQDIQATELYDEIENSISILISRSSDFSNEDNIFLRDHLYEIVELALNYNHRSLVHKSILNLFQKLVTLSISSNLNSFVIESFIPFFSVDSYTPNIFNVTEDMIYSIYDFTSCPLEPEMIILRPEISQIYKKLLNIFFDSPLMNNILTAINSNNLDTKQTGTIMYFFQFIQKILNEKLSLSLCNFFSLYGLKLLNSGNYNSEGIDDILDFFKVFIKHLPTIQSDIFLLSIEMLNYQNQNQIKALELFVSVVEITPVADRNKKIIKKTLISVVKQSTDKSIFEKIYENLPLLSQGIVFNPEDITSLVCQIRKIPNESNDCFFILKPDRNRPFSSTINNILVGLNLISCSDDPGIINIIFSNTISLFDKNCRLDSNVFKMTDKVLSMIVSDLNLKKSQFNLLNLGYFLANFPGSEIVDKYINKIIDEDDFKIYAKVLKRLTRVHSQFEGERLLLLYFQRVVDQLIGRNFTPRLSRLTEVVKIWIQRFSNIPESQIIRKLFDNIDYSKCPDEIPSIVSAVMSRDKLSKKALIRQLISKIMNDTVPEKHSNWAMKMAFDMLHDEKRDIEKIADTLFQALGDNAKRSNAIHMIFQGVLYEADFFNVGQLTNGLKIQSTVNDSPFVITVHPLHSARRIYTETGKFIKKRLSSFTLYYKNREILPDQALSSIPFKFNKVLELTAKIGENRNRDDYCRLYLQPIFIEYIQRTEKFTTLFNLMINFSAESEVLFLMLNMIDDGKIKQALASPIQQIFKKDYFMPIVDLDSFRLFPFIIEAARGSVVASSTEYISMIFQHLTNQNFDKASLLMCCSTVNAYIQDAEFKPDLSLIRKCLISSNKRVIRQTMAKVLTKLDNNDSLLFLLNSTADFKNRNKTKQFFSLLLEKNIDPILAEPILNSVHQYETEFNGNVDQTIIGILNLGFKPTSDSFEKVFKFLFAYPTVTSPFLPFLQTVKSRRAAYNFILKYDKCIDKISSIFSLVPENVTIKKLNDDFSWYKRGLICPLNLYSSVLISLYSIEPLRNYIISTKFDSLELKKLSNLFFDMKFTCAPTIDINKYHLQNDVNDIDYILESILKHIYLEMGSKVPFFEVIHVACQRDEKCKFEEKCQNVFENSSKQIIFVVIKKDINGKFKFPLLFNDYLLMAAAIKSDDNSDYSVIYRSREINDINDVMHKEDNYYLSIFHRTRWYIAENDELSRYDISNLPEHCFGGKNKKRSAFLLAYAKKNVDVPKIQVTPQRREDIDQRNAISWPSIVCHSREFVNFSRKLFELDIHRYTEFGFDAFFKIAVIDDFSLNEWKNFLIEKIFTDSKLCEIFLRKFISDEYLIEKVDLSENATVILPELFESAKKNFNIEFSDSSQILSNFKNISSSKQYGFVCDMISILITGSNLDIGVHKSLLSRLTECQKTVKNIYNIYDRVFKCFDGIMKFLSGFLNDTNFAAIEDLADADFLRIWFEIAIKSDEFKLLLSFLSSHGSFSEESSLIASKILESSEQPFSPSPLPNVKPAMKEEVSESAPESHNLDLTNEAQLTNDGKSDTDVIEKVAQSDASSNANESSGVESGALNSELPNENEDNFEGSSNAENESSAHCNEDEDGSGALGDNGGEALSDDRNDFVMKPEEDENKESNEEESSEEEENSDNNENEGEISSEMNQLSTNNGNEAQAPIMTGNELNSFAGSMNQMPAFPGNAMNRFEADSMNQLNDFNSNNMAQMNDINSGIAQISDFGANNINQMNNLNGSSINQMNDLNGNSVNQMNNLNGNSKNQMNNLNSSSLPPLIDFDANNMNQLSDLNGSNIPQMPAFAGMQQIPNLINGGMMQPNISLGNGMVNANAMNGGSFDDFYDEEEEEEEEKFEGEQIESSEQPAQIAYNQPNNGIFIPNFQNDSNLNAHAGEYSDEEDIIDSHNFIAMSNRNAAASENQSTPAINEGQNSLNSVSQDEPQGDEHNDEDHFDFELKSDSDE